jgi:branched-chain amino acid aminotransferase
MLRNKPQATKTKSSARKVTKLTKKTVKRVSKRSQSTAATPISSIMDVNKLTITHNPKPKAKVPLKDLKFGHTFTDHMLEIDFTPEEGWGAPRIVPHGPLSLDPAASSLHYGLQCFEGMKAYLDDDKNIRLFRPEMNFKRMNSSADRLLLPRIDENGALKCLEKLLQTDKSWIPDQYGYSLYLRPTLISATPFLGVAPPTHAKFFVIASPVGPYYPTGFAPVKLLADPQYVRAWPGGTGNIKCGGNYALSIRPQRMAMERGYQQLLWLFGEDHQVTEVGTMNQFWFMKSKKTGQEELVTAPLDGTILPGVTRDSVIKLARSWGINVREEAYTIGEVLDAVNDGRMIEAFGTGTAAIVSPVKALGFDGKDYDIPIDAALNAGKLTNKIADTLQDIQFGKTPHEWSKVVM